MKNGTPWIIALAVAGYLVFSVVSNEYANIRSAIGETKQKADSVADETKATMESIKQTIEDLRSKFRLLETQMEAKQADAPNFARSEEKTPEQPKTEPIKPTIVMYSASWCGPCQRWKRESMASWQSIGWDVSVIEDDSTSETVPRFEITDSDGLKFRSIGYLTRDTFARDRLQALQKRNGL